MRNPTPHLFLVLLSQTLLIECIAAPMQTNQLVNLIVTNKAGQYRLEPAWVGECRTTVRTGRFASGTSDSQLRFDLFSFFDKPASLHFGSRAISQSLDQTSEGWRHTNLHTHRDSFPTDAELTEARTISALQKILGPSQGMSDGWGDQRTMHSQAGWSYFRLRDDAALETLTVYCSTIHTNGQPDTYVDSIRIRRGTARPTR